MSKYIVSYLDLIIYMFFLFLSIILFKGILLYFYNYYILELCIWLLNCENKCIKIISLLPVIDNTGKCTCIYVYLES